jgi:hypothetical protein
MSLQPETVRQLVQAHVGANPVTLQDVLVRLYGKERVAQFVSNPRSDQELGCFVESAYEMVDESWKSKGVSVEYGPFIAPSHD